MTHREIRGKEITTRTPALIAAEAHLAKLQAEAIDGADDGNTSQPLDMGGLPASVDAIGNVPVRFPRHERPVQRTLPEALGASVAEGDAIPPMLNAAMRRYAARQAFEADEEDAVVMLMLAGM